MTVMTAHEAHESFLRMARVHCQLVQEGAFGAPTLSDLEFCGRLHVLIERGAKREKATP